MDADIVLVIFISGFNLFFSKYSCETNCNYFCAAVDILDPRLIYINRKCCNGWFDDSADSGRYDGLLGGDRQLSDDFFNKLPCQYWDA